MLRQFINALRKVTRDQRGNNLIAYALLLGAIGVVAAGYLANVSTGLKAGLNNQATKIAQTAGTYSPTPSSPTATSPSSPTGGTPTAGSPTSGSGGSGSSGSGNNGNNGNGNNGNGKGNGNGGTGNGNGNGNK